MKVYIVVTVQKGEPDVYADILGVFAKNKDAKSLLNTIKKIKDTDKREEYGCTVDFDSVAILEHTLN